MDDTAVHVYVYISYDGCSWFKHDEGFGCGQYSWQEATFGYVDCLYWMVEVWDGCDLSQSGFFFSLVS